MTRLSEQLTNPDRPQLLLRRGRRELLRYRMTRSRVVVGRGVDCDIRLPDPQRCTLSRRHFALELRSGRLQLRDLSRHGTCVDGEFVRGGERRLRPGSRIDVGPWTVEWLPEEPSLHENTTHPPAGTESELQHGMIGSSEAMRQLFGAIGRVAAHRVPVLIRGETGSGKECVARAVHESGPWASGPLVAVNCGAIHGGTAASELFGHERGAFTGAERQRIGALERAHGGTLFLDEIAELTLPLQAALLRVLETREVLPLGGSQPRPVSFRLLTATHRDLLREVQEDRFRQDLVFRIRVTTLNVPPLRTRPDDIPLLARHFLESHSPGPPAELSPGALEALRRHSWPGNVRELRNAVLRGLVHCEGGLVRAEHLQLDPQGDLFVPAASAGAGAAPPQAVPPARPSPDTQRGELRAALQRSRGNRTRAAAELGISRSTLYARLQRLGLPIR